MARLVDGDRFGDAGVSETEVWNVLVKADDSRQVGLDELDRMFQRGEVTEDTLVWKKGMRGWIKLGLAVGLDSDDLVLPASEPPTRPFTAPAGAGSLGASASSRPALTNTGASAIHAAMSPLPAVVSSNPPEAGAALPPPPRPPMPSRDFDAGWSSLPAAAPSGLPPAPKVPPSLAVVSARPGAVDDAGGSKPPGAVSTADWVKELVGDDDSDEGTLTGHLRGTVPPPSGLPPRSMDAERPRVARPVPLPSLSVPPGEAVPRLPRPPRPVPPPSAPPPAGKGLQPSNSSPPQHSRPVPPPSAPPLLTKGPQSPHFPSPQAANSAPASGSVPAPGRPPPPSAAPPRGQTSRPPTGPVPAPSKPPPPRSPLSPAGSATSVAPPRLPQRAVTSDPSVIVLEADSVLEDEPEPILGGLERWLWVGSAALVLLVAGYRHEVFHGAAAAVGLGDAVQRLERAVLGGAPFGTVRSVRELVAAHPVDSTPVKLPAAVARGDGGKR